MMQYWRNKSDTDMITEEIGNVFASHLSEIYKKELVVRIKSGLSWILTCMDSGALIYTL